MEFIRSGSIGLQWVAREATDNLLGYLRSLFTRSLSFSLPHFSLPLLHPHSHLLTFISLSLCAPVASSCLSLPAVSVLPIADNTTHSTELHLLQMEEREKKKKTGSAREKRKQHSSVAIPPGLVMALYGLLIFDLVFCVRHGPCFNSTITSVTIRDKKLIM